MDTKKNNERDNLMENHASNYYIYCDYKHRLDPEVLNQCPKFGHTPHDINHLFNCTDKNFMDNAYSGR